MRVLLVEDEPDHAIPIKDYLEQHGHVVQHTISRDGAMKLLDTEQFDVAAVDLVLVMSTGEIVAEAALKKGVGVVIMSAADGPSWEDLNALMEMRGLRIQHKLRKPVAPAMLLAALESAQRMKADGG
jgi:DNA-binding response OmpR family regulator